MYPNNPVVSQTDVQPSRPFADVSCRLDSESGPARFYDRNQ